MLRKIFLVWAAFCCAASAESADDSTWVMFAHCDGKDDKNQGRVDLDKKKLIEYALMAPSLDSTYTMCGAICGNHDLKSAIYANRATRVRICTKGPKGAYERDCVTSKPNSYPIAELRRGDYQLSHIDGTHECDKACVDKFWSGTSTRQANMAIPDGLKGGNTNWQEKVGNTALWHAWGNAEGLHFMLTGTDFGCSWTNGRGALTAYIDAGQSTTMTTNTATTATVTTNTLLGATSRTVAHLEAVQEQHATQLAAHTKAVAQNNANLLEAEAKLESAAEVGTGNTDKIDENKEKIDSLTAEVATLVAQVEGLTKALAAAASAKPSSSSSSSSSDIQVAAIESNQEDISLAAPGTVKLQTGKCGEIDLCEVATLGVAIQDALSQE